MPDIEIDEERATAAALQQLPLLAPPADQFARVAIAIARRKRIPRVRQVLFAVAAVIALAAVIPSVIRQSNEQPAVVATTSSQPPVDDPSQELIARNQWLEAMVRAQGEPMDAASAYASAELEDLIGMVDVQLSATDEPAEQVALWEQRLSLMQNLASVRTQSMAVVRNEEPAFMPASYQID